MRAYFMTVVLPSTLCNITRISYPLACLRTHDYPTTLLFYTFVEGITLLEFVQNMVNCSNFRLNAPLIFRVFIVTYILVIVVFHLLTVFNPSGFTVQSVYNLFTVYLFLPFRCLCWLSMIVFCCLNIHLNATFYHMGY